MRHNNNERRSRLLRLVVVALSLNLLAACGSQPQWPSITGQSSTEHTPGRWVWAELFTADVAAARQFYGPVFGWDFQTFGRDSNPYTLIINQGKPIAGILHREGHADSPHSARWVGLVSVVDVDKAAAYAGASGGDVLLTPRDLPGRGRVALMADPEGARFGVLRSHTGDPIDSLPPPGGLLWRELWARNGALMAEFYAPLGGYQVEFVEAGGGSAERHLLSGSYPRAGIVDHDIEGLPSAWLHYVRVADLSETLDRVLERGGTILIAPTPNVRQGRVAVVADPLGAAIGIAEWPDAEPEGGRP